MNSASLSEFDVTGHFYLNGKGGIVIGNIKKGIIKKGMYVALSDNESHLTISSIEYVDRIKEGEFFNALLFKEAPSLEFVKDAFPIGSTLHLFQ